MVYRFTRLLVVVCCLTCALQAICQEVVVVPEKPPMAVDVMRQMQKDSFTTQKATFGRWGYIRGSYSTWVNHSNRLIPVYTFGIDLKSWRASKSAYANPERLKELYGIVPNGTTNPDATYYDQTDLHQLQMAAIDAGYKKIIMMVFDGMDWQTARCASIYKNRRVLYNSGRGTGLAFQDYRGATTDFGLVCTSALLAGAKFDVNSQTVLDGNKESTGGYNPRLGGQLPWLEKDDHDYLIGLDRELPHTVTDSAASATSLFSGVKTYNGAINVTSTGERLIPIARRLQQKRGFGVGIVTSVPVSHATLAAAYANNVTRKDYQDLSRDLLGLPSVSHRNKALPGVDVLIGCGWGESETAEQTQGDNFVPGNAYVHEDDMKRINKANGGRYTVATRTANQPGRDVLVNAANEATQDGSRLLGFFGVTGGHLPYQTADGNFNPTIDAQGGETYTAAEIKENPTLADMTEAALAVLKKRSDRFWLLVEAGDVDWANHANNIDNSIGSVMSGEAAFQTIVDWVEKEDAWDETALIVTADHGHFFVLEKPGAIAAAGEGIPIRMPQMKTQENQTPTKKAIK